jgi:hypothetical protein
MQGGGGEVWQRVNWGALKFESSEERWGWGEVGGGGCTVLEFELLYMTICLRS